MSELSRTEEKQLLIQLKSGKKKAFDQLYQTFSRRIYLKLLKLSGTNSNATELLQETFITVWEKRDSIDPERPFKAWLYRVAENKVYALYRKISRDARLKAHIIANHNTSYSHTEEELCLKETRQLLRQAIERLSPQRKKVFELCRLEGRSYKETAKTLGISVSTVSNQLQIANKLVCKHLDNLKRTLLLLIALLCRSLL